MNQALFERFKIACEFQQPVQPDEVERLCKTYWPHVAQVTEYGSLRAAGAAVAAWDARAAVAARAAVDAVAAGAAGDAWAAVDARAARAAGAAWDAWDAMDVGAARAARAAVDAWDARAALAARAAVDAVAARDARDASYYAIGSVNEDVSALKFLALLEAGCWLLFDLPKQSMGWVRLPILRRNQRGQLHCANGPAFILPEHHEFFWNHTLVTEQMILHPETLTTAQIAKEPNAQVRQVMVERIGIERVCQMFHAKVLDTQGTYELLNLDLGDGRVRPYLKMLNPSVGCWHVEGVHPKCTTVQQAINWRAGHEQEHWQPEVLT